MSRRRLFEPAYCPSCRDGLAHVSHAAVRVSVVERFRPLLPTVTEAFPEQRFAGPGEPPRTLLGVWCDARITGGGAV